MERTPETMSPGEEPSVRYERDVDTVYVRLRDVPQWYTRSLDDERILDYAKDHRPVGIELRNVSLGSHSRAYPKPRPSSGCYSSRGYPSSKRAS